MVALPFGQISALPEMLAVGNVRTDTTTLELRGWLHEGVPPVAADTRLMVVLTVKLVVNVAVPDASSAMVCAGPPFNV